eukprot:3760768-Pyramimonas_sp.AAC.1
MTAQEAPMTASEGSRNDPKKTSRVKAATGISSSPPKITGPKHRAQTAQGAPRTPREAPEFGPPREPQ